MKAEGIPTIAGFKSRPIDKRESASDVRSKCKKHVDFEQRDGFLKLIGSGIQSVFKFPRAQLAHSAANFLRKGMKFRPSTRFDPRKGKRV